MPRELIAERTEEDVHDGTVLESRRECIYVAWGRDGGNVVGLETTEPVVQVTIRRETPAASDGVLCRELYSAALTVDEIEHLRRVLRKASRQVFGVADH